MTSLQRIRSQLDALNQQWRRAEIREKSLYTVSLGLVTIGLGLLAAQFLSVTFALSFIATVCLAAGGALTIWIIRSLGRFTGEHMRLAQLAEHLAPELGTGPTSAIDLDRSKQASTEVEARRGFSRELAEAHFEHMAEALDGVGLTDRLTTERRARDRRAWQSLGGTVALLVLALVALGTGRSRLIGWLADPTAARLSETPLASDITLTYRFPEYTHMTPRVVEGGDGSISAVIGTEVALSALADTNVRSGLMRLFGSDGKALQDVPLSVDGKKLAGTIAVLHDGSYVFELMTRGGERLLDGKRHAIHAQLDASPEMV
ncbi:MAG: hypothetical protein H7Z43_05290, partial [Clostridia bacterium]|nr:hypothetical protein [Deltaproteobacteria bacterium]